MASELNVLESMDISNPFGVPAGLGCGLEGMYCNGAHAMPLPLHLQEDHCDGRQDRGEPAADVAPPRRITWGVGPFNSGLGSAGSELGMAATAAARTAARTPSLTPSVRSREEEECYYDAGEFESTHTPRQMSSRGSSGLSSAPNLLQSHSNPMNDSIDSRWSGFGGRDSARRKGVTIFGGKTEFFGRTYDSTPTSQVFMEDIVNREQSKRGPQTVQRPPPRPAPDFRQTEAWQRAFALRQRNRRPKQPAGERPRVSIPQPRARSQQRGAQQHDAQDRLESSSRFVAMEDTLHGSAPGHGHSQDGPRHASRGYTTTAAPEPSLELNGHFEEIAHAGPMPGRHPSPGMQERRAALPSVVGWPWKGRTRKPANSAGNFDAQAVAAALADAQLLEEVSASSSQAHARAAPCTTASNTCQSNVAGPGAPPGPPMSSFPRSRSASPTDADDCLATSCRDAPLHWDASSAYSQRSPSTSNVPLRESAPLREMQRLLGETWRYQQLGDMAVAASHATVGNTASAFGGAEVVHPGSSPAALDPALSPVHFSHSDHGCAPPPICSDFVEVPSSCGCSSSGISAASTARPATSSGSSVSTPDTSKLMSPEYIFLGRLVATLPGEEAAAHIPCQGPPSTPQAVVECNFWQLREALGNSPGASAGNTAPAAEVKPPAACKLPVAPSSLLGASPPPPLSFSRSATSLLPPATLAASSLAAQMEEDEEFPPWPHEM